MITIKSLAIKNFLSVGQVTQSINMEGADLTLILGDNLDLGGDGARNGVGKTAMIQALSYALFGAPLNNIRKDNLINHTNEKNMVVTVEFSVNGTDYKITRGRKPNVLKFYVNNNEREAEDNAQGDSRETQDEIERILCMTHDMFKQIVALNTYNEPFLLLKAADQRSLIEQLLGITLLSEKAEMLKTLNKETKDEITKEEFRVRGVTDANTRIQEQITALERRQAAWITKHEENLQKLVTEYDNLSKIDIDSELTAHKNLKIYNEKIEQKRKYDAMLVKQQEWSANKQREVSTLTTKLDQLNKIDIAAELQAHVDLATYAETQRAITELNRWIAACKIDEDREHAAIERLNKEISSLENHKCHSCGQDFHDEQHSTVLADKKKELQETALRALSANTQYIEHTGSLKVLSDSLGTKPKPHYATEAEAIKHDSEVLALVQRIESKNAEVDPYVDQITELKIVDVGVKPTTVYRTEQEAVEHNTRVTTLLAQIEREHGEVDPYAEQLNEMRTNGLQEVSFDVLTALTKRLQHQEYLLDLLTNKKSFVRKRIIEQNLAYLNARLLHYLTILGLPHSVVFQNDLSVEISELGRELDFGNLSRGESTRLSLALSLAFRDVFESLYIPVNTIFVDEMLDNGLDTIGVENGVSLLKDMSRRRGKSVWLVSHREELVTRVNSVLKVTKESGFTTFSMNH